MKRILMASLLAMTATSAQASLTAFQTFVGSYGLSTDGGGSTGSSYAISAFVPVGASVTAAYLYQSNTPGISAQPVTLQGSALTFTQLAANNASLAAARADVTSIVKPVIDGGLGGVYNFTVGEGNSGVTDGTGLVVVYSLASLATSTVAILDGFSQTTGDSTAINFSNPLDPTSSGFQADIRLGIGFSCCTSSASQFSQITVNGTRITNNAGNNDDSGTDSNGALITVGGNDDAFSTLLPSYAADHERYNLTPYITTGQSSIAIDTLNPSSDDNIFLLAGVFSGAAAVNAPPPPPIGPSVPEPATWAMMIAGFGLVGGAMRQRRATAKVSFA